jgi:hypothetical protein
VEWASGAVIHLIDWKASQTLECAEKGLDNRHQSFFGLVSRFNSSDQFNTTRISVAGAS